MSIIFIFTRDNWRHRYDHSDRELVVLIYTVDIANEFHLLVDTYGEPLRPGHLRSSIEL
jgi:hypothetical protein